MEEIVKEEVNQEQETDKQLPAETEYRNLFQIGVKAYEHREFEEAAKTFMELYNKFPNQPEVLVNYADCQYELLNTEEAIKYWELAKEKDKYLLNPYVNLGNYYLNNDRYDDAVKEYIFAFCLNPHNETSLVNLAITYEKMNNKKQSFLLYEFYVAGNLNVSSNTYKNIHNKIAKHKLNAISQMRLAIYFEKKGFWRKALQTYFDSLRVFPNFAKTYMNIGNIFYRSEEYNFAKLYWLEAYRINKKNLKLILNLAIVCEKEKDYVNAYAFYLKFLQKVKNDAASAQAAQASLQEIHQLIMSNPEYRNNHLKQCEQLFEEQKFDSALIYYENLNALSSKNEIIDKINKLRIETNLVHKAALVSFEMAQDLFEKGKYEFAIEKCKLALSLWKNSYFEQNIKNLLVKCQTIVGNSINDMIKSKY